MNRHALRAVNRRPVKPLTDATMKPDEVETAIASNEYQEPEGESIGQCHALLFDLELEMCVIGAMLMLYDDPVTAGMKRLRVQHFKYPLNQTIFKAIEAVEAKRRTDPRLKYVDYVSVGQAIRQERGLQDKEPGCHQEIAFMGRCIESCPTAANMDYYIDCLIAISQRRHIHALAAHLQEQATRPDADAGQLANATHHALDAIEQLGYADIAALFELVS